MDTMIAERPAAEARSEPAVRAEPFPPRRAEEVRPPLAAALLPYGIPLAALQPR